MELAFALLAVLAGAIAFWRHEDVSRIWASAWKSYTGRSPKRHPAFFFMGYRTGAALLFVIGVVGMVDFISGH